MNSTTNSVSPLARQPSKSLKKSEAVWRLARICALLVVTAIAVAPAAGDPVKGDLFSDEFDGSELDADKWMPTLSGAGEVTVGGGFLKIKSPEISDDSYLDGVAHALDLGSGDDWQVEVRFAVLDETPLNSYNGEHPRQYVILQGCDTGGQAVAGVDFRLLADASGPSGDTFSLAWGGMDDSNPSGQAKVLQTALLKNSYYTLSAHRKPDGNVDIFLDGDLLVTQPVINSEHVFAALRAGDLSVGNQGTLSIDYVRVGSSNQKVSPGPASQSQATEPIVIGDRRELFLDNLLVDRLGGGAQRVLHKPVAREVVMIFDQPWEGNACAFVTDFRDGERYRMYYRAENVPGSAGGENRGGNTFDCYAESPDGIHWTKPSLGLVEFKGSKENNIIPQPSVTEGWSLSALNPFLDKNPAAAPDALYKAVAPLYGPGNDPDNWHIGREKSLAILKSADGIHWSLMQENGIVRNEGFFDSQNVAYWDQSISAYRTYFRDVEAPAYFRDIKTATSPDFVNWTKGTFLNYSKKPTAQFYNNAIRNYHRAPHIYLGLPMMYDDRPWTEAMEQLPDTEKRRHNVAVWDRPGPLSEVQLMWSRDGESFELSPSTFMPPGPERPGTYTYYDAVGWHLVETASNLEGAAPELTLYRTEFYQIGVVQLRRYTLRLDGFASIHAPIAGGELITPPVIFKGSQLSMNFASSAFGSLRVEIQDADGKPIPGFILADSIELYGDTVARSAIWKDRPDLGALAGKPVRLRFVMKDADLYSIKFE